MRGAFVDDGRIGHKELQNIGARLTSVDLGVGRWHVWHRRRTRIQRGQIPLSQFARIWIRRRDNRWQGWQGWHAGGNVGGEPRSGPEN
jgi:hypothetical protein